MTIISFIILEVIWVIGTVSAAVSNAWLVVGIFAALIVGTADLFNGEREP